MSLAALAGAAPGQESGQESPKAAADEVLVAAREIYTTEGPRSALPEFERALALYRAAGDRLGEAVTIGYIGNCHKRFGDFDRALELLSRALATKRELGDRLEEGKTLSHLGLVYWEMGAYDEAIEQLEAAMAIGRAIGHLQLEGSALNNLSLVYDELGDYERSLEQYERALALYAETDFPRGESDTLGNIGGVHLLLGRYGEAAEYYRRALALSEALGSKPSMSQDLGNLAICQLGLGEVETALETFDRALALARDAGLEKEEADWVKGKAEALVRSGRYDLGLELHREALETYQEAGLKRELIEALAELGRLHLLLGDAASAEADFTRALELARSIGHARGVTTNLIALGSLEWKRGRYEQAVSLFRKALERASEAGDLGHSAAARVQLALSLKDQGRLAEALSEARSARAAAEEIETPALAAEALYAEAEVERLRGEAAHALELYESGEAVAGPLGEPELGWRLAYGRGQVLEAGGRKDQALAAYRRAAETIESVRDRLREERFRAGYIEDRHHVYVALVRLLLELDRAEEAFEYSERLRARAYLGLLNRGLSSPVSVEERRRETELRQRIRQLQQAIEIESESPHRRRQAMAQFSVELARAEREYQEFLDDLRARSPRQAAALALAVPSSDEVREALGPGSALVEYVLAGDGVIVFVLTAEGLHAKRVEVGLTDLHAKVVLLRSLVQRPGSDAWRLPAASLASLLVEPIEAEGWLTGVDRLYLVPHGMLHYLPFAALPRQRDGQSRFLIEDFALAVLPAAASLVYEAGLDDPGSEPEGDLFALSPAASRLRWASHEIRQLARLFAGERLVLDGSEATEAAFKARAPGYRVIHLATHGYLNKRNPLFSGLLLEPAAGEDGRLEVHEILRLDLAADLVGLSACDTALGSGYFGEVPAGDDFIGLTRAFLFAGSASVLASLWPVDDRSTPELMERFYERLGEADRAAALAGAQRTALGSGGEQAHPYYWAPFVLVGSVE